MGCGASASSSSSSTTKAITPTTVTTNTIDSHSTGISNTNKEQPKKKDLLHQNNNNNNNNNKNEGARPGTPLSISMSRLTNRLVQVHLSIYQSIDRFTSSANTYSNYYYYSFVLPDYCCYY